MTAFGTMIFIPRYWSIDRERNLKWGLVTRLHRCRGVSKQGEKLFKNFEEHQAQAIAAKKIHRDATAAGFKGEKRERLVMAKLGFDSETDRKQLWRLLNLY